MAAGADNFIMGAAKKAYAAMRRVVYGDGFFFVCIAVAFLTWLLSSQFPNHALVPFGIGAGLFTLLAAYVLFFGDDLKPIVAILSVLFYMAYLPQGDPAVYGGALAKFAPFAAYLALIAAGFVFFFVKHRHGFKKTKLFWPVIIFAALMPFAGLFSGFYARAWNLAMFGWMMLLYPFLTILMFSGTKKLTLEYFSKCVLAAGAVVLLEMVVYYLRVPDFFGTLASVPISLGWGLSNNLGILFAMCVPAALYLSLIGKKSDVAYAVAAFIFFAAVIMTVSRGSILFSSLAAPFLVAFYIVQSPKGARKRRGIALGACLLAAAAVCVALPGAFNSVSANIGGRTIDSGRFDIWKYALEVFKRYPIFGSGYGYSAVDAAGNTLTLNNPFYIVSNTFLQFLTCGGIIGLAAGAFFFVRRYILFYDNWKPHHVFFLIMMLIYDGYSLIDGCCFLPYIVGLTCFLFIALEQEEVSPKRKLIDRKEWSF